MANNPAINHGIIENGDVHFTIVKEGRRLVNLEYSTKRFVTNLYIYYKDKESLPFEITDEGQIFDDQWIKWKSKAFMQTVDNSILDGHG